MFLFNYIRSQISQLNRGLRIMTWGYQKLYVPATKFHSVLKRDATISVWSMSEGYRKRIFSYHIFLFMSSLLFYFYSNNPILLLTSPCFSSLCPSFSCTLVFLHSYPSTFLLTSASFSLQPLSFYSSLPSSLFPHRIESKDKKCRVSFSLVRSTFLSHCQSSICSQGHRRKTATRYGATVPNDNFKA